jgi:hypothetical protein
VIRAASESLKISTLKTDGTALIHNHLGNALFYALPPDAFRNGYMHAESQAWSFLDGGDTKESGD